MVASSARGNGVSVASLLSSLYPSFVTASFVVFATGLLQGALEIMLVGVFVIFIANVMYAFANLKNRLLFLFLHGGIFLFLLTRPLVGSIDPSRTWMLSSHNSTQFALFSLYISMACLLLGAVLFEGMLQVNSDWRKRRSLLALSKAGVGPNSKANKVSGLMRELSRSEKMGYIRNAALICYFVCLLGAFADGAIRLEAMQGHSYEEYYLLGVDENIPWVIGVLKPMMPYMLCAFLATLPKRRVSTICLALYVSASIPMLMIGSRSDFVISFLFAGLYYIFRHLTDREERWITRRVALGVLILAPLGIVAMGAINYLRAGTSSSLGFFALFADALFKQGVTFTVLGHGYDVNPQIQDLGFRFYSIGAIITNVTQGFIGQTFLGCQDLGETNSALLALNSSSYAHAMSYFAHPNYLGGEGYGSSYILELYADFGYGGIVFGSILLGMIFCLMSRCIGRSWFWGMVALTSSMSVFHMPRGYAIEWISFLMSTRFLLAVTLILACSALLAYFSRAKSSVSVLEPEKLKVPCLRTGGEEGLCVNKFGIRVVPLIVRKSDHV